MILFFIIILTLALLLYACATGRGIRRSDARADRDPITGVIRGLEAITIPAKAIPEGSAAKSGPACLLVHGFVGSRRDFAGLGEYLSEQGFTVRMMRLPGHGTTPVDFAHLTPGALLKAVHQEYLNLRRNHEKVYLIGFSMGGALSTILASQENPAGLVLVAPYFGVNYRWYYILPAEKWNALFRHVVHYTVKPEWAVRVNDKSVLHEIFTYDYIPTAGVKQLVDAGLQAKRPKVLENIKCPVLVIHSSGDAAACYKQCQNAYSHIASPKKECLWLTRSNHHIMWDYDREQAKERIGKFLEETMNDE